MAELLKRLNLGSWKLRYEKLRGDQGETIKATSKEVVKANKRAKSKKEPDFRLTKKDIQAPERTVKAKSPKETPKAGAKKRPTANKTR